tara:strand:+ start:616 stop:777 length:162 start_codon:yes stop_codon:yes gene_type:complete
MKAIFIIVLIWILYQIKKFITGIQISNKKNHNSVSKSRKSGMDIQEAEYEDVE